MRNSFIISFGKLFSHLVKRANLGHGSTWPGHIALILNPRFIHELLSHNPDLQTIVIAGTNGKTTTAKMLRTILEGSGKKVIQNDAGANLLNGIASTLLLNASPTNKIHADYVIFEVDENALSPLLAQVKPDFVVLLNLFRDQLDRYGEVRAIAAKWKDEIGKLDNKTALILNADDPEIAFLAKDTKAKIAYFGLDNKTTSKITHEHAVDSVYCPRCGTKLSYKAIYLSHLGEWSCPHCKLSREKLTLSSLSSYPLPGVYNRYNALASILVASKTGIEEKQATHALSSFTPAFGRQEMLKKEDKNIHVFLSKNPTGMNEALKTVKDLKARYLLFLLNDRAPDGRDVSWIWDVDFEEYVSSDMRLFASGDRAFDMGLRLKYAHPHATHVDTYANIERAFPDILSAVPINETLYILPTYSAMLDIRKQLTGKKIL